MSTENMKHIWTVTVISDKGWKTHCRCWYPTFEQCEEIVLGNVMDIHECEYMYAVIEKRLMGLMPTIKGYEQYFYEWEGDHKSDAGRYVKLDEPPMKYHNVIWFGIG